MTLSPTQRAMLAPLRAGHPVPMERLVNILYANRYDGGPEDAPHTVRQQMYRMRQKLANLGISIETAGLHGRGSLGYVVNAEHRQKLESLLETR